MLPRRGVIDSKQTWNYWRGSPLLLAHVLRTMESAIEDETGADAKSVIDIEIAGDHERFSSASDFHAQVTEEALRRFSYILVRAWNEHGSCELTFTWLALTWRSYPRRAGKVDLAVTGLTGAAAERMFAVVQPAARRGDRTERDRQRELASRVLLAFTFLAGIFSAGYLLDLSDDTVRSVASPISGSIALICTAWLFPAIEVVPARETRRLRVLRIVGPIIVSVILAGVTKALWH
jgi:hypothetical protein